MKFTYKLSENELVKNKPEEMNNRKDAEQIFLSGVRSVLPDNLINGIMSVNGSILTVGDLIFNLDRIGDIYVIGAGKASAAMAHYVEAALGNRIREGHVVVKYDHSCKLRRIQVTEAGHPIPDINGFNATEKILEIARKAGEDDLVICLISGGGSALLADIPEGCLPEELAIVNNLLIRCGATIKEINTVRKHLSAVKGGQLVRVVWPATLVNIILSDVIGNPLDVIASGPTVPDESTFGDALRIISDYRLKDDLTAGVIKYLTGGAEGIYPETPKPGDNIFSRTYNIMAGTNMSALEAARVFASSRGYNTFIISSSMQGDVADVAVTLVESAIRYRDDEEKIKPVCLLYGGETTIRIEGSGLGGRNQHLALKVATLLHGKPGITVLCAGTDGTDGPTDVAGAVVDSETMSYAYSKGKDPVKYLEEFNSCNFFRSSGGQIITGPTFTNVMDLVVILIT